MKFNDLDARMRVFEDTNDLAVLPGLYIAARVDGRGFTRLTRELHSFEAPFDPLFRDHMVATAEHLMGCGFSALFGFTQSDEISILLGVDDTTFGRKLRKLNSVLAGEASALFSCRLGAPAAFDCRISQLPSVQTVVDYFQWRQADGTRNALNAHCYWLLRQQGASPQVATNRLRGLNSAAKNELLFQAGINFNELPGWQKRGIGLYPEAFTRAGHNPLTGETVFATRQRIRVDDNLPMKDEFGMLVRSLLPQTATAD